jgi:hypothetical protein
MTPNDDGNPVLPTGGAEQPTSQPSGGQGQQLSDVSALVKQVQELQKEIRGLQKGTDKRLERQDSNIKRILELKEQGLSETQIQRELWIDSQIQGQDAPPPTPVGNGKETGQAPDVSSAFKTVEEYGLSTNDPDFLNLIRSGKYGNQEVNQYILGKVKPTPPASPAGVVQAPATGGATPESPERLKADYIKEMTEARGRRDLGKLVQEKYRKLGLDLGSVDFRV